MIGSVVWRQSKVFDKGSARDVLNSRSPTAPLYLIFCEDKGMYIVKYPNEFYHYGVKGMKWGVRKEKPRSNSSQSKPLRGTLSNPKVKKAAKIAAGIALAYGVHKVINNPELVSSGKNMASSLLSKTGSMKMSVVNSAEFKAIAKLKGPVGKMLGKLKSDDFAATVTGIGAMATTAGILRTQIKDLKENKVEGDAFDKAVKYTQKASSMGENVINLAKGPKAQTKIANDSANKAVSVYQENGKTVKATRKLTAADKNEIRKLRRQDPSLTMAAALYRLGLLDTSE